MSDEIEIISEQGRAALLREGIVVLSEQEDDEGPRVYVTGVDDGRVRTAVAERVGSEVDVWVCGEVPRELRARPCVGYVEPEPGYLELRYLVQGAQHLDDVLIAEDDDTVVVYGTVCTSVFGDDGDATEASVDLFLERPVGDRVVIDGFTGDPVPQRDVYAELRAKWRARAGR